MLLMSEIMNPPATFDVCKFVPEFKPPYNTTFVVMLWPRMADRNWEHVDPHKPSVRITNDVLGTMQFGAPPMSTSRRANTSAMRCAHASRGRSVGT